MSRSKPRLSPVFEWIRVRVAPYAQYVKGEGTALRTQRGGPGAGALTYLQPWPPGPGKSGRLRGGPVVRTFGEGAA